MSQVFLGTSYLSNVIKGTFEMCVKEVFEQLLKETILKYFCNYIFYKVLNNTYLSYVFICNILCY